MASKKTMQQFNKKVESYLISIGAKKVQGHYSEDFGGFCYEVQTKAGVMNVIADEPDKSEVFTVFVRFEEPEKVKEFIPNIYHATGHNGKWNIHEWDAESAMNCLEYRIEKTALHENKAVQQLD